MSDDLRAALEAIEAEIPDPTIDYGLAASTQTGYASGLRKAAEIVRAALAKEGSPVGLDEAWAKAEAALPAGYCIMLWESFGATVDASKRYVAKAKSPWGAAAPTPYHYAETPAAALLLLATQFTPEAE